MILQYSFEVKPSSLSCFYGLDLNSNCNERHIIFHFNFSLHKMLNIKPSLTAGSSLLHCLSPEQPTDPGKHQIFSSSISDQCVPWWWVLLIVIPCWSRDNGAELTHPQPSDRDWLSYSTSSLMKTSMKSFHQKIIHQQYLVVSFLCCTGISNYIKHLPEMQVSMMLML